MSDSMIYHSSRNPGLRSNPDDGILGLPWVEDNEAI
jgi:hypothetical protein